MMQNPSLKHQYFGAAVVSLLLIGYGVNVGWCSPSIILLTSDDSPLASGKITMEEASWIVSILCIGALFGNFFFGFITNAFGRKMPLFLIAIPTIIGWLLILNARNVYYLYVARASIGFIGGGIYLIVPLYLNEIASDSVRGLLGSTMIFSLNIGMLLAFVLGNYCAYETTPKIVIILTVLYLALLSFLYETPIFLMKQGKIAEAEKSIRFYQNRRDGANDYDFIQSEIEKLTKSIGGYTTKNEKGNSFSWSDLTSGPGRKAMIIGIFLITIRHMCGCYAMLNYTANIFKEAGSAGSSLSPNMSAIIVGVIQLIGSFASSCLVERAGRKILFVVSTLGTALGLTVLGTFLLLKRLGIDVEAVNWIPVASFSFVIFIASWALLPLPFLVIAEVMPEKVKAFGFTFCMTLNWVLLFFALKLLPLFTESLGFHGTMFSFAGWCLLGAAFIILYMPETKGKSYEHIMNILQK